MLKYYVLAIIAIILENSVRGVDTQLKQSPKMEIWVDSITLCNGNNDVPTFLRSVRVQQ